MHNSRTPRRSCEVQSPGGVTVTFESSSAASNVFRTVAYYCAEHNRPRSGRRSSTSAGKLTPSTEAGMAPVTSRADNSAIRIDGTMLLDMEMLESGAQAARRSASTRLTQSLNTVPTGDS